MDAPKKRLNRLWSQLNKELYELDQARADYFHSQFQHNPFEEKRCLFRVESLMSKVALTKNLLGLAHDARLAAQAGTPVLSRLTFEVELPA